MPRTAELSTSPFLSSMAAGRPVVQCFAVQAAAEPGALPRVLELFAKRGLVPLRLVTQLGGPASRELSIDLQISGLSPATASHVARCLAELEDVRRVLTAEKAA